MLPVVLALGAFVGALLMGAAALSVVGGERRWRGHAAPDARSSSLTADLGPAFRPLEMAPFTLQWPSEVERRDSSLQELPWPSETWDDEYFGTRSRDDVQRIARTAEALDIKRERTTKEAMRRPVDQGVGDVRAAKTAAEEAPRAHKKKKKGGKKEPRAEASRAAAPSVPEPPARADGQGALDVDEIVSLVEENGLAGAVDLIRQRHGVDFRTATQLLAETLRRR